MPLVVWVGYVPCALCRGVGWAWGLYDAMGCWEGDNCQKPGYSDLFLYCLSMCRLHSVTFCRLHVGASAPAAARLNHELCHITLHTQAIHTFVCSAIGIAGLAF